MNIQLAERLLEERKRLRLNQTEFAAAGGVVLRTYVNYEKKGHPLPDVNFLQGIHNAGADVMYILTGVRQGMSAGTELLMQETTAPYVTEMNRAATSLQSALRDSLSSGRLSVPQLQALELLIRSIAAER